LIGGLLLFSQKINAQNYDLVKITGVFSGNGTNNILYKASSPTIPSLVYIRAQRIEGPQDGIFTQYGDNMRYTSISNIDGIPDNLSRIRFSFLQLDRRTPILLSNFRFIINDIDGPNNEALATSCNANVCFIGTSNPSNLMIDNIPPDLNAVGSVNENDGATSRVMFEFKEVAIIEFDNYANDGYLKDFDMNNDYPISTPVFVECVTKLESSSPNDKNEILQFERGDDNLLVVHTNPIYFDLDKAEIRNDAALEIEKVVAILKKHSKLIIEIRSHTDSRAKDEYNITLSNKRANLVIEWIVNRGIVPLRVSGKGFGETQLINNCSNEIKCSEEQHQLNRRVQFIVVNPEVLDGLSIKD